MKYTKLKLITCLALIVLMLAGTITVYAAKEKNGDYTGNWQFVNTIEDIPISGHVLLSHAKDTKNLFYGELSASESNKVTDSLNNTQLQIQDETKKSFMLIQDGQSFYIQLADGTYLKREGNLTNATLSQTDDIVLATKFRIEDGALRPPINSIPGLGTVAAEGIEAAKKDGPFMSKDDLRIRSKIGSSVMELLDKFGCLKGMPESNQLSLFG